MNQSPAWKAEALGATVKPGISWTLAVWPVDNVRAAQKAKEFDDWCREWGYETRVVYPPHIHEGYGVRFR